MPSEVKMPQLGMVQDSGIIVAWLKKNGDPVKTGEPIFEVETDKATMEVEAAADGYLSGVRAAEGDDVPVGGVIAMIVENEADIESPVSSAPTPVQAPAEKPAEVAAEPKAETPKPAPTPEPKTFIAPASPQPLATGRVLASPKARRMAAERGIDLAQLRAHGIAEPIHVADLDKAAVSGGQSALSALVECAALDGLLERSENPDRTHLLAAFAAGAWRALFQAPSVSVAIRALDGSVALVANPDRGGEGETAAPALSLVDLCDTRLSSYASAGGGVALSVAKSKAGYALTLSFSEAQLPMPHAAALLDDIAARVEDPIRQLL